MVMKTLHVVLQHLCSIGHIVSGIAAHDNWGITYSNVIGSLMAPKLLFNSGQGQAKPSVNMVLTRGCSPLIQPADVALAARLQGEKTEPAVNSWATLGWYYHFSLILTLRW